MLTVPAFQIEVWSKGMVLCGETAQPISVSCTPRHNAASDCEFTVDADHPRVTDLTAPGARVVVWYRPDDAAAPVRLLSGTAGQLSGEGPEDVATRTFTVYDDWNLLADMLGWVSPDQPITNQGGETAYWTRTGPAEDLMLEAIQANATRLGLPLTVPTSEGRGATIGPIKIRMTPLTDDLFPAFDTPGGLGVKILQVGNELTVQIYEPNTYAQVLTEGSGIITQSSYQRIPPTLTSAIVGCGGQAEARIFRQYVKTDWLAEWGFCGERFIDARDIDPAAPDLDVQAQARADDAFTQGAEKASLSVELVETDTFQYAVTYREGDRVSFQAAAAPVLTDLVREVEIDWTVDDGLTIVPHINDWQDSTDDRIYAAVSATRRDIRNLQRI